MSNNLQISYSSSGTFDSCNRKFEFRKIYPRSKPRTSGFAAEVGKCLHEGFQNFLIHQSEEQAIWALLESFPYELEYYETKNDRRSEEHTSELQSLMHISYAVFCLKKKIKQIDEIHKYTTIMSYPLTD